ncbi:MAG: aldolase [Canidatus Methanoxibalbensis ujae]|nr:aldolase [Candidatus Methanoxibalbensis ujae]MCW7078135.1 aldolase [Candidatus Methanoxibalbensis ujae]
MDDLREKIADIGRRTVLAGLVNANFGNISVRKGDKMLISRTGAFLDMLHVKENLVEVEISCEHVPPEASSEVDVHREIYRETDAHAILHTHSPFVVAISIVKGKNACFRPEDVEGTLLIGEIPIVSGEPGSNELARNLASALKSHRYAIAHAHGGFAIGNTIEDAFIIAAAAEHSCKVKLLADVLRLLADVLRRR